MAVAITEEFRPRMPPINADWHRTAPRRVVKKHQPEDPLSGWSAWQKHLAHRKQPITPPFLAGPEPPLLWSWPNNWGRPRDAMLLSDSVAGLATTLRARPRSPLDWQQVIDVLSLAYALPDLAAKCSAETWWQVAEQLHDLACDAQQQQVDWPADFHDVLRNQLLAGELALALGYLFPEVLALRRLRKTARATFSEALAELTDGEGLPHARLLPVLGPLFACWTRARWLGSRLPRGPWSRPAEKQYHWLVRHAIRLADANSRFLLSPTNEAAPGWSSAMFPQALRLVGNRVDCAAATAALPGQIVLKDRQSNPRQLPSPSLNSDWSGISVMANGWTPESIRFAVAYADDPCRLELTACGARLLAGAWGFETTCDGKLVKSVGDWENLCWQSDKTCDLLELGMELTDGLRLERQVLLGKRARVLYLSDLIFATDGKPRRLTHSLSLPLDGNVQWRPESETRDGVLLNRQVEAAVLPLGLPEWRTDPRGGKLVQEDGRLVLTQEATGRAMCCPLLFDLNPSRTKKERTWRQLTVGEWMEVVPRDVAVGFRAQSGRGQWLFYRSLGPAGNRTVMGLNIAGEFCAGRFHKNGQFDDWIEIEAV